MDYTCKKCKQKTSQLNWSFESKEWICPQCDFKEKKPLSKEVKTWRDIIKNPRSK